MVGNMEYLISDILKIRKITKDDTENIVKWRNNPRVCNNFIYRDTFTIEGHNKWMETKVASGEVEQFIIETVQDGPVGSVYFRDIDKENKSAEYGIFIGDDDAVGKGYGSLVAKWAVAYARDEMHLSKMILRVFADNISARKSYEKAGFSEYKCEKAFMEGRDLIFMGIEF